MKKALFVILASVAVAQASAYPKGNFSTGNDWLWQAQDDEFSFVNGVNFIVQDVDGRGDVDEFGNRFDGGPNRVFVRAKIELDLLKSVGQCVHSHDIFL